MFTPPPLRKKPEGPKNFREFWQSLKDTFRRLLYIYQLVWDARPSVILLMALFSLFNGVLPVISTYISKMILDIFVQASGHQFSGLYAFQREPCFQHPAKNYEEGKNG